jgi:uncharacterized YccA/Bax inhibitor family protein
MMNENVYQQGEASLSASETMSIPGTVNKTAMLTGFLLLGATWVWHLFYSNGGGSAVSMGQGAAAALPWMLGGIIGGLILALITTFKPDIAFITAPIYAVLEGLALGGVSAFAQARFPNSPIVIQAVALTMCVLLSLLAAYRFGLVKATEQFRSGLMAAAMALCLVYFLTFIVRLFGVQVPFIHDGGIVGILFSLVAVTIASLFLVLDFDFVEKGVAAGAPKSLEWYAAFSLLVTLVWVYLEILNLLQKLNSKR